MELVSMLKPALTWTTRVPANIMAVQRMHQRASWIGAEVTIDAKPGQGTRIQVIWEF